MGAGWAAFLFLRFVCRRPTARATGLQHVPGQVAQWPSDPVAQCSREAVWLPWACLRAGEIPLQMSGSKSHAMVVTQGGDVYVWGSPEGGAFFLLVTQLEAVWVPVAGRP